jgi:3-hydroxyisobutyrate dehydrogenase-like beta-hydroxyacid dehydrogenase
MRPIHPIDQLALYGFGLAASSFARVLRENNSQLELIAYDKYPTQEKLDLAQSIGVEWIENISEFAARSELILSLVRSDAAVEAAVSFAIALPADGKSRLYIDANSVPPQDKIQIGQVLKARGVQIVDAAVCGYVPKLGLAVPILLSGAHASDLEQALNQLAFNCRAIGTEAGQAAAMKLSSTHE